MKILNNINNILEKINSIKNAKRIGIEKISSVIGKDKSVTSRILNGKYSLDLMTFINICIALDENPVNVLNESLFPKNKIVSVSHNDVEKFYELVNVIKNYIK